MVINLVNRWRHLSYVHLTVATADNVHLSLIYGKFTSLHLPPSSCYSQMILRNQAGWASPLDSRHPKYPNLSIVTDLVEIKRMVWFGISFVSMHAYHMAYIDGQNFFCRVIFYNKSFTWTADVGKMMHAQPVAHADRMAHAGDRSRNGWQGPPNPL